MKSGEHRMYLPPSRIDARRLRSPTYRGMLCPGHGRERYTRNGKCVVCWDKKVRDADQRISRCASVSANNAKRNAQPGAYAQRDIKLLFEKQRGRCLCGVGLKTGYHVDHIMPLSRGGTHWPHNLQLLCEACNTSKGSKTMKEWRPDLTRDLTPDEINPMPPEVVTVVVSVRQKGASL